LGGGGLSISAFNCCLGVGSAGRGRFVATRVYPCKGYTSLDEIAIYRCREVLGAITTGSG